MKFIIEGLIYLLQVLFAVFATCISEKGTYFDMASTAITFNAFFLRVRIVATAFATHRIFTKC